MSILPVDDVSPDAFHDRAVALVKQHGWTNLEVGTALDPGGAVISFELQDCIERPGIEIEINHATATGALRALQRRLTAVGSPS